MIFSALKKHGMLLIRIVVILFIATVLFLILSWIGFQKEYPAQFGVTFSTLMARQLGLDPKETYRAMVDDLGARRIRLPVYWNDVEKKEGEFYFDDYDYFVKKAENSGVKLVLAVGQKLPRWPECHAPAWATFEMTSEYTSERSFEFLKKVVNRYKSSPTIEIWQVENEPFHVFGSGCASSKVNTALVDREIAFIRSQDARPVMLTDSGEQGVWSSSLRRADILGISMYYQVWNDTLHVVRFPFGPGYYLLKGKFFGLFYPHKKIYVSELQVEPWGPSLLPGYDLAFQKELMNPEHLKIIISRAKRSGFSRDYLWGAEWWYWLKTQKNDSSMWDEAKRLFE